MHPIDQGDRRRYLKDVGGVGYCNITKCCTEVCPEHIKITDNAIILLKERVADEFYDPLMWAWRKLRGRDDAPTYDPLPMLPSVALGASVDASAAAPVAAERPVPTAATKADEPMATAPEEGAAPANRLPEEGRRGRQAHREGAPEARTAPSGRGRRDALRTGRSSGARAAADPGLRRRA